MSATTVLNSAMKKDTSLKADTTAINTNADPKAPSSQVGSKEVDGDEAPKLEAEEAGNLESALEPGDDNPEPEGSDGDPEPLAPLNEERLKGDSLTPIELPEYDWAEDRVGLSDGLKNGKPVEGDKISQMKLGQLRQLLKANRIHLDRSKYGTAVGFVDHNGELETAKHDGMRFTEVIVKPADADRITTISFQYDEYASRLHRSATSGGDANVGIPGIFRVQSSYRTARATRSDKRIVAEHKSYSHIIPKARVVLSDDSISLSEEFVNKIKQAVASGTDNARAEKLLGVLAQYGQFFASDVLLGGRLNYSSDKRLEDSYDAREEQDAFRLAANARASIDGVPVEGGVNWETGLSDQEKKTVVKQASSLTLKMVGGNEALVSPQKWIPTVAKYLNWKVVGFSRDSLVLTIEYLQDRELRAKCLKALRSYFAAHLQIHTTELVGATHAPAFGYDVKDVKRIVKIEVNHGINVDGLSVTYELLNGRTHETQWAGYRRGEHNSTVGLLAFDEELTSVETALASDGLIRRLAFNTSKGRRFPESPSDFYGRGHSGESLSYTTIQAPRVCGIVGHSGKVVDSIGLRYRELQESGNRGPLSRQFLLDIEPLLFPLNLPNFIEMTFRGVLLAGGWRGEDDLDRTSTDNKRNTLIVELANHSNHGAGYLQGLSDDTLVRKAAIVILLETSGLRDQNWLKGHSFQEHRDDLIERINSFTDEPLLALKALSDDELVRWASTIKSDASSKATSYRAAV